MTRIFTINEGIQHIEEMDLDKFLHVIDNLAKMQASEKVDGCLAGDTVLTTLEYGDKTLSQIVEGKIYCHVKAYSHIDNEIVYTPIFEFSKTEEVKQWFRITLENGTILELTGNHPVWLNNLQCYRRTDELTENDMLTMD